MNYCFNCMMNDSPLKQFEYFTRTNRTVTIYFCERCEQESACSVNEAKEGLLKQADREGEEEEAHLLMALHYLQETLSRPISEAKIMLPPLVPAHWEKPLWADKLGEALEELNTYIIKHEKG